MSANRKSRRAVAATVTGLASGTVSAPVADVSNDTSNATATATVAATSDNQPRPNWTMDETLAKLRPLVSAAMEVDAEADRLKSSATQRTARAVVEFHSVCAEHGVRMVVRSGDKALPTWIEMNEKLHPSTFKKTRADFASFCRVSLLGDSPLVQWKAANPGVPATQSVMERNADYFNRKVQVLQRAVDFVADFIMVGGSTADYTTTDKSEGFFVARALFLGKEERWNADMDPRETIMLDRTSLTTYSGTGRDTLSHVKVASLETLLTAWKDRTSQTQQRAPHHNSSAGTGTGGASSGASGTGAAPGASGTGGAATGDATGNSATQNAGASSTPSDAVLPNEQAATEAFRSATRSMSESKALSLMSAALSEMLKNLNSTIRENKPHVLSVSEINAINDISTMCDKLREANDKASNLAKELATKAHADKAKAKAADKSAA